MLEFILMVSCFHDPGRSLGTGDGLKFCSVVDKARVLYGSHVAYLFICSTSLYEFT